MRHPRLPEIVKCIFLFVVIGLGCSALYGSGGVSELLEAVFVPDATAIRVLDLSNTMPKNELSQSVRGTVFASSSSPTSRKHLFSSIPSVPPAANKLLWYTLLHGKCTIFNSTSRQLEFEMAAESAVSFTNAPFKHVLSPNVVDIVPPNISNWLRGQAIAIALHPEDADPLYYIGSVISTANGVSTLTGERLGSQGETIVGQEVGCVADVVKGIRGRSAVAVGECTYDGNGHVDIAVEGARTITGLGSILESRDLSTFQGLNAATYGDVGGYDVFSIDSASSSHVSGTTYFSTRIGTWGGGGNALVEKCSLFVDTPTDDQTELSHVGESVRVVLTNHNLAGEQGKTWDYTPDARFGSNWIQIPLMSQLGKSTSELVVPAFCTKGDDACDEDFGLYTCGAGLPSCPADRPSDPEGVCTALKSTVSAPGGTPSELCVGHSVSLYEEVYSTIIQAERYLDISSLELADGIFLAAIRNAITFLDGKDQTIDIRFLTGLPDFTALHQDRHLQRFMTNVTRDIREPTRLRPTRLRITIGQWFHAALRPDVTAPEDLASWNHAKIIAVDGRLTLEGGHNWASNAYLKSSPILDASLVVEGDVAKHAHRFLDQQWHYICTSGWGLLGYSGRYFVSFPDSRADDCAPVPLMPPGVTGDFTQTKDEAALVAATFSVGHLGPIGGTRWFSATGTSDAAITAMFDSAKGSIKLALQDLGPAFAPAGWYMTYGSCSRYAGPSFEALLCR